MHGVPSHGSTPSFRDLLGDLGQDVAALLHDEIDLVTQETRTELRASLLVLGILSVLSIGAVLTLCAAAVLALARVLEPALAAVLVGTTLALVAAGVGLATRRRRRPRIAEETLQ